MLALTTQQALYIEKNSGIPLGNLIERAGRSIVNAVIQHFPKQKITVLCGPGNNGQDGKVAAKLLKELGWNVDVLMYGHKNIEHESLLTYENFIRLSGKLIIDALFGIGLSRDIIDDDLFRIFSHINSHNDYKVISVDIPSGIDSNTGQIKGIAFKAMLTVTFISLKIGHLLNPGAHFSGKIIVENIGISFDTLKFSVYKNDPYLWQSQIPKLCYDTHKYKRGYALVCADNDILGIGAAKLAAMSALRVGAGAVSIATNECNFPIFASFLGAIMYKPYSEINDPRITAILVGPGNSISEFTKTIVLAALKKQNCVLDASAISLFEKNPKELFDNIQNNVILTPHEGEFKRLFPELLGDKLSRARDAAQISKAVIVLKGNDTIIADPNGKACINCKASPALATLGSGDTLAGIITGLLSIGMEPFAAACCGVWLHAECAQKFGIGLTADDIPNLIPMVLNDYSNIFS